MHADANVTGSVRQRSFNCLRSWSSEFGVASLIAPSRESADSQSGKEVSSQSSNSLSTCCCSGLTSLSVASNKRQSSTIDTPNPTDKPERQFLPISPPKRPVDEIPVLKGDQSKSKFMDPPLPTTAPPYTAPRGRHERASDAVSSGSSGLATMSVSSTDNLPCSSSSLASSSDSSTCCSNAPTMTNEQEKKAPKKKKELQFINNSSNSDSTLTKTSSQTSTCTEVPSASTLFATSPSSTTCMPSTSSTPKRGNASSRTISSSSNTTGSSSSTSFHQTSLSEYVHVTDVGVQTTGEYDESDNLKHSFFYQNQPSTSKAETRPFPVKMKKAPKDVKYGPGMQSKKAKSGQKSNLAGYVATCTKMICTPLRTIVSQNRRRYIHEDFNLDLTYITDRIIAMGYPADTNESIYRNSMNHIVNFLERFHPQHYKVFNLRGQHVYAASNFDGRVVSFEMTDHHPPRLELMAPFCREVHEYLEADQRNIVAVHCKAGKGRTGVMICAYLAYINFYPSPRQNMDYYSIVRTHNNKGVTIPSQRRYVYYFNHLRKLQLNYMPLKVELVGIYVEKPPKLNGAFSKGALKLRVANGDVDVFEGEEIWISNEAFEEEERLHREFPNMIGPDHHDPQNPRTGQECISRRCYGWTVPANKRVFLEGDVRVDLYHSTQLKVIPVRQDRKKFGHIWFNTMFTCPGFCGRQYVHGDEEYQSITDENHIVKRQLRRKGTTDRSSSTDDLYSTMHAQSDSIDLSDIPSTSGLNLSSSVPSSPPVHLNKASARSQGSVSPLALSESAKTPSQALKNEANKIEQLTPPSTKQSKRSRLMNGFGRKRNDKSPLPQEGSSKPRNSQDSSILSRFSISSNFLNHSGKNAQSSSNCSDDFVEEYVVMRPPGLDRHCPESTLKDLYPTEAHPPRMDIENILREAGRRNLLADTYNARRLAAQRSGPLMPKSPVGRPEANGPFCVMRQEREHVSSFGALEIDRVHKRKDIDLGFRVIIVTRCIDEAIPFESQLARQFVNVSRRKQKEKDKKKREHLETQERLLHESSPSTSQNLTDDEDPSDFEDEVGQPEGITGNLFTVPSLGQNVPGVSGMAETHVVPESDNPLADPRVHDPHLSRFYFRQRVTSQSRHPDIHYHCPLIPINQAICARYACPKRGSNSFVTPQVPANGRQKPLVECDENGYKVIVDSEDSCFNEEFEETLSEENDPTANVTPEQQRDVQVVFKSGNEFDEADEPTTSSAVSSCTSSRQNGGDSEPELSEIPERSGTMTVPAYAQCRQGNQIAVVGAEVNQAWRQRPAQLPREEAVEPVASTSAQSAPVSSRDLIAQTLRGDSHPNDSNWCSSTSSSCQSILDP